MSNKISQAVSQAILNKIHELAEQLVSLTNYKYDTNDLYYKVGWYDAYYVDRPSNNTVTKTLDEAVTWLSKESHPMNFTGCAMNIELYYDIAGESIFIEGYDAEKLIELKLKGKKKKL